MPTDSDAMGDNFEAFLALPFALRRQLTCEAGGRVSASFEAVPIVVHLLADKVTVRLLPNRPPVPSTAPLPGSGVADKTAVRPATPCRTALADDVRKAKGRAYPPLETNETNHSGFWPTATTTLSIGS